MKPRTNGKLAELRSIDALKDMARKAFRELVSGQPEGPTLKTLGGHPGVPCQAELSRQRNGHGHDFLSRGVCILRALREEGMPKAFAMKVPEFFTEVIDLLWEDEDDDMSFQAIVLEAQIADTAEDTIEARAHADGFALGTCMGWLEQLREESSWNRILRSALTERIHRARARAYN